MPTAAKFQTPWMGGGAQQANVAVTVYRADGTTTATVYTSTAGTTTASNPVNTDASGVLTTYLVPGRYVLTDSRGQSDSITVGTPGTDRTIPNITGVKATDGVAIQGQILAAGAAAGLWTDSTT